MSRDERKRFDKKMVWLINKYNNEMISKIKLIQYFWNCFDNNSFSFSKNSPSGMFNNYNSFKIHIKQSSFFISNEQHYFPHESHYFLLGINGLKICQKFPFRLKYNVFYNLAAIFLYLHLT